jgi:hypothetical protein
MEKQEYPEELSERESEEYESKNFNDSDSYAEDYKQAVKYAKRTKGQIYTMVDGENNKTCYLKGLHWVNRFGFCVFKKTQEKKCK